MIWITFLTGILDGSLSLECKCPLIFDCLQIFLVVSLYTVIDRSFELRSIIWQLRGIIISQKFSKWFTTAFTSIVSRSLKDLLAVFWQLVSRALCPCNAGRRFTEKDLFIPQRDSIFAHVFYCLRARVLVYSAKGLNIRSCFFCLRAKVLNYLTMVLNIPPKRLHYPTMGLNIPPERLNYPPKRLS